jgi:hypothetical protein
MTTLADIIASGARIVRMRVGVSAEPSFVGIVERSESPMYLRGVKDGIAVWTADTRAALRVDAPADASMMTLR